MGRGADQVYPPGIHALTLACTRSAHAQDIQDDPTRLACFVASNAMIFLASYDEPLSVADVDT